MEEGGGADEETPDEHLGAGGMESGRGVLEIRAGEKQTGGKEDRDEDVEAVKKNEFGVLGEIADFGVVSGEIASTRNPADVRPPKTMDMGRVCVLGFVRVLMMVAMMISPPEGSALHASGSEQSEQELAEARGAVRFVGKIAVVDACDRKHADEIEGEGDASDEPTTASPDHSRAAEV